jgi:hypothetical protein
MDIARSDLPIKLLHLISRTNMLLWKISTTCPEFDTEIEEMIRAWRKEVDLIRGSKEARRKILTLIRHERNN